MRPLVRECVRKMSAYTPGEQPSDLRAVKLNTNENPYPPSPAVMRALREIGPDMLRRYPDPDCKRLRARIAVLHRCRPEQVFIGNGSDEILALCSRAFVEDGGRIAYFDPSYSLYPVLARIRNVKELALKLGPDFVPPDTPRAAGAGLFFLTNPNAPTGILYPKARVAALCRRFKGVVVIDEAYVDFARENCMGLALKLKNAIVLRTLSKSYSLAGLRVGYAVGPRPLIAALNKIKDSYNVDRISQVLAEAAIGDQAWMRANARRIAATRGRLARSLAGLGFLVCPSQANFLFVKPSAMKAEEIYRQLRARDILVRYFARPLTRDFLRISIGTDEQAGRLVKAIASIQGKKT